MAKLEQQLELLMKQNAALMELLQVHIPTPKPVARKRKLTFEQEVQIKMRELQPKVYKLLDKQTKS